MIICKKVKELGFFHAHNTSLLREKKKYQVKQWLDTLCKDPFPGKSTIDAIWGCLSVINTIFYIGM